MPQPAATEITKLCDDWCTASAIPDGGFVIGANTEKFRLLANGVVFHELDHEAMCAAIMGLSKVLLRPGLNTIIDHDHFGLWSWCGELLLNTRAKLFKPDQHEIKSLYETAIHAALADCRRPPASVEEHHEHNRIRELQPHHTKKFAQQSSLVLAYLVFPLLEAILKRACTDFVAFDGQVVSRFTVSTKAGTPKKYDPKGSYPNRQCSSIRDLLFLHYTQVAKPELKATLDRFRDHITIIDGTQDPFDIIHGWRNQSLHGSTNFQTIGGTMLNLSLLISLFEIQQDFEHRRIAAIEFCRWQAQSRRRDPWSFYPPY